MKRLMLTAILFLFTFGCSNDANSAVDDSSKKNISLEQQIVEVMKKKDFYPPEKIVDYEIKDDYIYVFSYATYSGFSVAILKYTPDSIEWVMGKKAFETASFGYKGEQGEESPVLTVVQTDDPDVKGVKVMGENAKLIQLTRELTEDYSKEIKFWIHFTEMTEEVSNLESLPSEKVEFIR